MTLTHPSKKSLKKIDAVSERQQASDKSLANIKTRVDNDKATLTDIEHSNSTREPHDVVAEVLECQLKVKNVILCGIPESLATTAESRIAEDKLNLQDIF